MLPNHKASIYRFELLAIKQQILQIETRNNRPAANLGELNGNNPFSFVS
jgi:hypothetical protein